MHQWVAYLRASWVWVSVVAAAGELAGRPDRAALEVVQLVWCHLPVKSATYRKRRFVDRNKKNILQLSEVGSGAPNNANSTKQKQDQKYHISQYRRYRVLAGSLTSTTSTRWNCSIFPNRIVVTL